MHLDQTEKDATMFIFFCYMIMHVNCHIIYPCEFSPLNYEITRKEIGQLTT